MQDNNQFFTGAEAMSVFKGEVSVSSVVEVRARGLQDSDVDPANEDANIVSKCRLGSGAVGTVYELTRSDGKQVVFKGEAESRTGLASITIGSAKAYTPEQMIVNFNIASKKAAVALGMGDMIVDYSAGSHNGVFGFYMEKAKGVTIGSLCLEAPPSSPEAGMSPTDFKRLSPAERRKIQADIKRELNRLQWLDLVTYNALMELKEGPKRDAYLDSIRPRLSEANYNSAVSRLDDVIAHAEQFKDKGKVIEGAGWQDVQEEPVQTGEVPIQKWNGKVKNVGGDIENYVHLLTCPSYFARDEFTRFFG